MGGGCSTHSAIPSGPNFLAATLSVVWGLGRGEDPIYNNKLGSDLVKEAGSEM